MVVLCEREFLFKGVSCAAASWTFTSGEWKSLLGVTSPDQQRCHSRVLCVSAGMRDAGGWLMTLGPSFCLIV